MQPLLRKQLAVISLFVAAWAIFLLSGLRAEEHRKTALVRAVAHAQASVVNIRGEKTVAPDGNTVQAGMGEMGRRVNGMGSGVVIDPRGYVLTNFHVVDGVRKIRVTLLNGQAFIARVIAQDESNDLAVIKIDNAGELPVIDIGTSSDLMLAEPVVAVGNPFGYEHTVTRGIISALRRTVQVTDTLVYEDLIQIDAPINPGNSGGPLLNADGKLIGITVAVRAGAQGIAFAIAVDKAMDSAATMLGTSRGIQIWHGAVLRDDISNPESPKLLVERVHKDSPAEQAGLQAGDVITSINSRAARRRLDLERSLLSRKIGDELPLTLVRDGKERTLNLRLADRAPAKDDADDAVWTVLGLRLEPVPKETFKKYATRYHGGVKVREVRTGSPAHAQGKGIRRGDVLLGIGPDHHVWETISVDNVLFVIKHPEFDDFNPLKFYILRDQETLYGHMRLSEAGD